MESFKPCNPKAATQGQHRLGCFCCCSSNNNNNNRLGYYGCICTCNSPTLFSSRDSVLLGKPQSWTCTVHLPPPAPKGARNWRTLKRTRAWRRLRKESLGVFSENWRWVKELFWNILIVIEILSIRSCIVVWRHTHLSSPSVEEPVRPQAQRELRGPSDVRRYLLLRKVIITHHHCSSAKLLSHVYIAPPQSYNLYPAIEDAKNNMGDFNLKTATNYKVPEAQRQGATFKRAQLLELRRMVSVS